MTGAFCCCCRRCCYARAMPRSSNENKSIKCGKLTFSPPFSDPTDEALEVGRSASIGISSAHGFPRAHVMGSVGFFVTAPCKDVCVCSCRQTLLLLLLPLLPQSRRGGEAVSKQTTTTEQSLRVWASLVACKCLKMAKRRRRNRPL